jgi:hypothetical protein
MSEQVNDQITDQKAPSKEELITFFKEQIDVKKVQLELQELNTKLAVARAEELKALSFIGQITNPAAQQNGPTKPHTVTQDDLDANPELIEAGVKVGDEVLIPADAEVESKPRKLKKEKV